MTDLKLNGAIVCSVKCIEKIMCVHACICNEKQYVCKVSFTENVSQSRFRHLHITSMREELCVNVFECVLIYNTTGAFLWKEKMNHDKNPLVNERLFISP